MASQNPFQPYDILMVTNASIQAAHANGWRTPPTSETTVLAVSGEQVLLSDGSQWHHSHFEKVGESTLKEEVMEVVAAEEAAETQDMVNELSQYGEFDEFTTLVEVAEYIAKTYGEHYAKDGVQAFALIAKRPQRGLDFAVSNGIKYLDRFGEKAGRNRKDLLKAAHYIILALHCADRLDEEVGHE